MRLTLSWFKALSFPVFLGITLLPIYIWKSGGVQISHAILSLGAILVLISKKFRIDISGILLVSLTLLMSIRDGIYVFETGSLVAALPVFYSMFSLLIYLSMREWLSDARSWGYLRNALVVAGVIAVVGVYWAGYGAKISSDGEWRSIGTFNNPNQLGYFSVCLFSLSALLYVRGVIGRVLYVAISLMALFLSVASLSKAAMLSCGFGLLASMFVVWRARGQSVVGGILLLLIFISVLKLYDSGALNDFKFTQRIHDIGSQDDDSLSERGYFILSDIDAKTFLFGRGSESVRKIVGHEVHSTIASFFACYGYIVGLGFVLFLLTWVRKLVCRDGWLGAALIAVPPMMYGITHNGSRFTIFWILIAASMSSTVIARNNFRTSPDVD